MMEEKVPDEAVLLDTGYIEDGPVIGLWRGPDSTIYIAVYHYGPHALIIKHQLEDHESWVDEGYLRTLHYVDAQRAR